MIGRLTSGAPSVPVCAHATMASIGGIQHRLCERCGIRPATRAGGAASKPYAVCGCCVTGDAPAFRVPDVASWPGAERPASSIVGHPVESQRSRLGLLRWPSASVDRCCSLVLANRRREDGSETTAPHHRTPPCRTFVRRRLPGCSVQMADHPCKCRNGRMQLSRADALRTAFTQHGEGSF